MKRYSGIFFLLTGLLFLAGCSSSTKHENLFGDKDYVSPHNAEASEAVNQSQNLDADWWKSSSFYHIWVKSFYNSDGKDCGDLKGITEKLDYIQNTVGCDAIWLSPIFKCKYTDISAGGNMHGYDTVDYYSVNPYFGSEADLIELINACHSRGMKIIFDFVPNHTATTNKWFEYSKAAKTVDGVNYTDWYVWSNTKKDITNTMKSAADSWHSGGAGSHKQYYYGCFDSGMPDLNYANYAVREEMKNVARYWLNKGFDGLRLDGARYLCEDFTTKVGYDTMASHEFYRELRAELNKYDSPKFMVCEAWLENNRTSLDKYFGNDDEFNVVFDFDQGKKCTESVYNGSDCTGSTMRKNPSSNKAYGTFLGNHDEYTVSLGGRNYIRFGSALGQDALLIRQAIGLSLMRPTIPFIYYGNEFGIKEYGSGGDTRARGPMEWNPTEAQIKTTEMNKAFTDVRRAYPEVFQNGNVSNLSTGKSNVMAYTLTGEDAKLLCIYNLSNDSCDSVTLNISCSSADLLIGGGSNSSALVTGSSVKVNNLGPRAVRVYLLNDDDGKTPYYSDEESYGGSYTPPVSSAYKTVSLMGTVTDWNSGSAMTLDTSSGKCVWSISKSLTAGTQIQFKFQGDGGWLSTTSTTRGSGITLVGSDNNFAYTPSSDGTYKFTYNETDNSCSVVKQ